MSFLKAKVICPHCNRESADNQVCTNLGCGKRFDAPVRLFARTRTLPVRNMGVAPRSLAGATPETVQ
jgi:hypothetical protein